MIIHLQSTIPKEGYRLFAKNKQTAETYYLQGYNSMFLLDGCIQFVPEDKISQLNENDYGKLQKAENHDVFHVSRDGIVRLVFEANSIDNTLMVTGLCNSNCIMCPAHDNLRKNAERIQVSSALELIQYIPEDTEHITITGGEPFMLKEDLFTILAALKERLPNTNYQLLTNGRALSYKPYFEKFVDTCPPKTLIGIPIHGHDANTHDYITRSSGSFDQTRIAIKNLVKKRFSVELRLVISKLNEKDITEIGYLIRDEFPEVDSVKFMGLEMLGNAAVHKEMVWLPYREAFLCSKKAIETLIEKGIETELYNFPLCAVDRSYHLLCKKSITGYKVRFSSKCSECIVQDACGGFFAGSIRLAEKDIIPWRKYD